MENDDLQSAQLEKLRLEIAELKQRRHGAGKLTDWIPIMTALIAVAGFLGGIVQNNATREKEFKKVFWEKQLQNYMDASGLAAKMVTTSKDDEKDAAYRQFQEIYQGQMVLVEDVEVKDAMKHFIEVFIDYRHDPGLQDDAQTAARILARTCRESLSKSWDVKLEKLDTSRF